MSGYAYVDTETSGFRATDRVVQIAVVHLDENRQVTGTWWSFVNPRLPFIGGYQVHQISTATVADAPTFPQLAPLLRRKLAGRTLVAHNLNFDRRMLNQEFARLGDDGLLTGGICTVEMARRLLPKPHRNRLEVLCRRLGVHLNGAHDALQDALAGAAVFAKLAALEDGAAVGLPAAAWLQRLALNPSPSAGPTRCVKVGVGDSGLTAATVNPGCGNVLIGSGAVR